MPVFSHFKSQRRVPLPGSKRKALPVGTAKTAEAAETISVSVIVRPQEAIDTSLLGTPEGRLSRAEYTNRHGAHADSVRLIRAFAEEFGLKVEAAEELGPCTLRLTGTVVAMQEAFAVTLKQQELDGVQHRVREGEIHLPEELSGHVVAVLGLDNRPQAKPHFRIAKPHASNTSYTPPQVAQLYGVAAGATATGQTIGIIELGGGFRQADLNTYFKKLGLTAPTPVAVSVDKGKNSPGTADGADGEMMLDIEVCASVAAGAKIAVYFAPNTDQGFIDAISTAMHDTANAPMVISISWGGPESSWTAQAMTALDAACHAAAALGVTIPVACGDDG